MKRVFCIFVFLFLQKLRAEPISVILPLFDTFSRDRLYDFNRYFQESTIQNRIDLRQVCVRELQRNFQNTHQKKVFDLKNTNQIAHTKEMEILQEFPQKTELISLHKTFVAIVEEAELVFQKSTDFKIKDVAQQTVKLAVCGCELNKLERVDIARGIAHFCAATIVVVKAISRGVSTGVKSAIHTIINPLESVSAFLKVAVQCGNLIGAALLDDDCDTSMHLSVREQKLIQQVKEKELDSFFDFCSDLKSQIAKMSGPELVETTTALMMQSFIFGAMPSVVKLMHKMVRAVSAHAKALQKNRLFSKPVEPMENWFQFFPKKEKYLV